MHPDTVVYDLTPLTRHVKSQRRTTIAGFDVAQRTLVTFGIGALVTLVVSVALWPLLGQYGIIVAAVAYYLGVLYVRHESSTGLGISPFHRRYDRIKSNAGKITIMGDVIDLDRLGHVVTQYRIALPVPAATLEDVSR